MKLSIRSSPSVLSIFLTALWMTARSVNVSSIFSSGSSSTFSFFAFLVELWAFLYSIFFLFFTSDFYGVGSSFFCSLSTCEKLAAGYLASASFFYSLTMSILTSLTSYFSPFLTSVFLCLCFLWCFLWEWPWPWCECPCFFFSCLLLSPSSVELLTSLFSAGLLTSALMTVELATAVALAATESESCARTYW